MIQNSYLGMILFAIFLLSGIIPSALGIYMFINFLRAPRRLTKASFTEAPKTRFAIVIPARNESGIISHTVRSLKALQYPPDLRDILVIADNCSDNTAALASTSGARVFVRNDISKISKAHALKWLFEQDEFKNKKYDAICILDADAILAPDFLNAMDAEITKGYEIVQGRCGSTNPYDTAVSGFMAVLSSFQNRFWYLPQANRNKSTLYIGTGACITMSRIEKTGWNITTLVEDAEFSIQSVLKGGFVRYCDHARYEVEQVATLRQLWKQQRRWRSGQLACLRTYLVPILKSLLKDHHKNAASLLILVLIPVLCLSAVFQLVASPVIFGEFFGYENISWVFVLASFIANTIVMSAGFSFILWLDGVFTFKLWKGILAAVFAPYFYGIVDIASIIRPKKEWNPILHGQSKWFKDKTGSKQFGTTNHKILFERRERKNRFKIPESRLARNKKTNEAKPRKKQLFESAGRKK
jgi:cellulose synthase/poly-beta-1,6-N-acetylglucosamine synthase-like glycosyltransferase